MSSLQELEKKEMYDWAQVDLFNNPPYRHYDMVVLLAEGRFVIEGKQSDIHDAEHYADHHPEEPSVWQALDDYETRDIPQRVY